jgi:hypothetical protein
MMREDPEENKPYSGSDSFLYFHRTYRKTRKTLLFVSYEEYA